MMKSGEGRVLYVGKAKSLRARVRSHFSGKSPSLKNQLFLQRTKSLDYIVTDNEAEAFLLEASMIKKHKPRYNVRLTDDKAYPYIRGSVRDKFPRLYIERKTKDPLSLYFGPYTAAGAVRTLVDFLNQSFQIRDCPDADFKARKRPCLTHQMGFCGAPCAGMISEAAYRKGFQKAIQFLRGNQAPLIRSLRGRMARLSKELRFEEAGRLRDRLRAVNMMEKSQTVMIQKDNLDRDIAAAAGDERGTLMEVLHLRRGRMIGSRSLFFKGIPPGEEAFLSFFNQYYADNLIPDELVSLIPLKPSSMKSLERLLSRRRGAPCRLAFGPEKKNLLLLQMANRNAKSHFQDQARQKEDMREALAEIQQRLFLPGPPLRMECYDVSHWQGGGAFGSQAVFQDGVPEPGSYRLYGLRAAAPGDDYAGLQELLERRLRHAEYEEPDMILIDGGRGQLMAARKILEGINRLDIPLAALAKDRINDRPAGGGEKAGGSGGKKAKGEKAGAYYGGEPSSTGERFYLPGRKNPVRFPAASKGFRLLLHLRDEAHRFAIESHRKRRDKKFLLSDLDLIEGMAAKRKRNLLKKFGSMAAISQASEEDLASAPSVSRPLARRIKKYFDKNKAGGKLS